MKRGIGIKYIAVLTLLITMSSGFAALITYNFESGTNAVDTGGGGFNSTLNIAGMYVTNSGAKFGTGSLRIDGNTAANYAMITDLTGSKAALNTAVSNFSFSTFIKADSVTSTNTMSQLQVLFVRRAVISGRAGQLGLEYMTTGKLRFTAYYADGSAILVSSTAIAPITAGTYKQLGVTYDAVLDQVKFYADGAQLGTTVSATDVAGIPAISSVPTTAYLRFAMDTAINAGGMNYDNIIYDTGSTYSDGDMLSIYNTGTIPEPATIGMLLLGSVGIVLARRVRR